MDAAGDHGAVEGPLKTDDGEVTEAVTETSGAATRSSGRFTCRGRGAGPLPNDVDHAALPVDPDVSDGTEVSRSTVVRRSARARRSLARAEADVDGDGEEVVEQQLEHDQDPGDAAFIVGCAGVGMAVGPWWNVRRWRWRSLLSGSSWPWPSSRRSPPRRCQPTRPSRATTRRWSPGLIRRSSACPSTWSAATYFFLAS